MIEFKILIPIKLESIRFDLLKRKHTRVCPKHLNF